jgi:hypothetical protein
MNYFFLIYSSHQSTIFYQRHNSTAVTIAPVFYQTGHTIIPNDEIKSKFILEQG